MYQKTFNMYAAGLALASSVLRGTPSRFIACMPITHNYPYGLQRISCSHTAVIMQKPVLDDALILGVETSCDDTGAAVVRADGRVMGEALSSQEDIVGQYGGVVPKMARERHAKVIDKIVYEALAEARIQESDLSAVAVTIGPGLSPCLDVGVRKARSIARKFCLPLIGVHHMEAHALVARLTETELHFPFIVLLVSGGHNLLLIAKGVGQYLQLGTTIDDAIGEAYDKTARLLGLDMGRGGGAALEKLALEGNPNSYNFSVPMCNYKDCNFSYAGLKNQVRLAIAAQNINGELQSITLASSADRQIRANIAASFQRVAVLHLERRCHRAIEWATALYPSINSMVKRRIVSYSHKSYSILYILFQVISGGVASNKYLRSRLNSLTNENNLLLICPPPRLCTDNGVMVAWTGIEHFRLGMMEPPPPADEEDDAWVDIRPRWQLGDVYKPGLSTARSVKQPGPYPSLTSQTQEYHVRMHSPH